MTKSFTWLILAAVFLQQSCAETVTVTLNNFKKEMKSGNDPIGQENRLTYIVGKNDLGYPQFGSIERIGTEAEPYIVISNNEESYWRTGLALSYESDNVVRKKLLIQYDAEEDQHVKLKLWRDPDQFISKAVFFNKGLRQYITVPFIKLGRKRFLSHVQAIDIIGSLKIFEISLIQPVTLKSVDDRLSRMEKSVNTKLSLIEKSVDSRLSRMEELVNTKLSLIEVQLSKLAEAIATRP